MISSAGSSSSKYNSLELAERESKAFNANNQIEILDNSAKEDSVSTNYNSDINTSNLLENIDNMIDKDPQRLDLLGDKSSYIDSPNKQPNKIANCYVFCYFKDRPLFSVGPHCKIIF